MCFLFLMGSRLYSIAETLRYLQYLKNAGSGRWRVGSIDGDLIRGTLLKISKNMKETGSSEFDQLIKDTEEMLKSLEGYGNENSLSDLDGDRLENYAKKYRGVLLDYFKDYAEDPQEEIAKSKNIDSKLDYITSLLETTGSSSEFIESSPEKRELRDRVFSMIQKLQKKEEICFTGYFDQELLDQLNIAIKEKQISIRIICQPPGKKNEDKRNLDALQRVIKKGGRVMLNPLIHARIVLCPKEILVGSADMKANSFGGGHYEASLFSDDPKILKKVRLFFEKIWEESQEMILEKKEREHPLEI